MQLFNCAPKTSLRSKHKHALDKKRKMNKCNSQGSKAGKHAHIHKGIRMLPEKGTIHEQLNSKEPPCLNSGNKKM